MATFQQIHCEEKTGFLNVKDPRWGWQIGLSLSQLSIPSLLLSKKEGGEKLQRRVKKTS